MNFIRKTLAQQITTIATDDVVAGTPIPAGGKLNQVHMQMDVIEPAGNALGINQAVMYGVAGYVVPTPDPDTSLTYQDAWDEIVPKAEAHGTDLDIDTGTADTDPEFEPGFYKPSQFYDMMGLAPRRFFQRRKLLTYAEMGPTVGSAAIDTWNAADHFTTRMHPRIHAGMPSFGMIGFSSPDLLTTSATIWTTPASEAEWAVIQYLDLFLENAFMDSIGFGGGASPFLNSQQIIEDLIAPHLLEETAAAFKPIAWVTFTKCAWNISVPGRPNLDRTLTAG